MSQVSKLAGVCGWPIHHSLSPVLHNYWLRQAGIAGVYIPFAVRPDKALRAFRSLKKTSIAGVNVTLPLKALAFEAADERTEDAQKLGVANCLYKRNGKLIAHNTDLEGFAAPLIKKIGANELSSATVLIIGAGGAARAVIGALLSLAVPEIRITNRTDEKATALTEMVDLPNIYMVPWADRNESVRSADIIINASAGGMSGKPALDINLSGAMSSAFVYDLIYTPQNTPLLRVAKARKLETLGGLEMLIAQARPSFKLFYDVDVPKDTDPREILISALKSGVR